VVVGSAIDICPRWLVRQDNPPRLADIPPSLIPHGQRQGLDARNAPKIVLIRVVYLHEETTANITRIQRYYWPFPFRVHAWAVRPNTRRQRSPPIFHVLHPQNICSPATRPWCSSESSTFPWVRLSCIRDIPKFHYSILAITLHSKCRYHASRLRIGIPPLQCSLWQDERNDPRDSISRFWLYIWTQLKPYNIHQTQNLKLANYQCFVMYV